MPPSMSYKVTALATESAAAISFLEQHGVTPLGKLAVLGGHSHARTHRPTPGPKGALPVGFAVTAGLRKALGEQAQYKALVTVGTGARVRGLWCEGDEALRPSPWSGAGDEQQQQCRKVAGVWVEELPAPPARGASAPASAAVVPTAASGAPVPPSLLRAQAVILASGGYAASQAHLSRWAPSLARLALPKTNGPWATGDAIDMALVCAPASTETLS